MLEGGLEPGYGLAGVLIGNPTFLKFDQTEILIVFDEEPTTTKACVELRVLANP